MNVTGIDATYYIVKDLDGESKFYTELFGAEPSGSAPGVFSEWTFAGGESFGLYKTSGEASTSGTAMFAVADVAKAVKDAQARGVKFHEGGEVTDTPACHMAFGEDPEGHQFILHRRKAG